MDDKIENQEEQETKENKPNRYWNKETCYGAAKECNSRKEFYKKYGRAYQISCKEGWIDDFIWLKREQHTTYTYEDCYNLAKNYDYKVDFAKNCKGAYSSSCKHKWIETFDWFLDGQKRGTEKHIKWTYEKCYEEAKKYDSRISFCHGNNPAYESARKHKWLDDYTWFKYKKQKPKNYWNYETCYEEAKKYTSRNEFKHENSSAYNVARKNKWIDDYDWLMPQLEIWTYEKCLEIAQRCVTKADFKKTNSKAYQVASHNGWMEKFDWLLDGRFYDSEGKKKGKSKRKPNKALESKEKTHCIYVYEFGDNHVYVGLTMIRRIKSRDYEHIFSNDTVSKYALEKNVPIPEMKIILTDLTPLEARNKEGEVLEEYVKNGWAALNKAKTGSLGSYMHGYWSKERCMEESKKYKTLSEYQDNNQSSYYAARVNGWIEEFTWLERQILPSGYWNYEHCMEESKKYERLIDFKNNSQRAYNVAMANGWISEYTWLKRTLLPKGWWDDYNHVYEEAKKYDSRISFCHGNNPAYESARKHKWLDDYTWFKYKKQKPKNYWNYETCYEEAKKYNSRKEFSDKCNRAYLVANKNGWLSEYTWLKRRSSKSLITEDIPNSEE